MEGLIPYIIDAIRDRKQKQARHNKRSFSRSGSSNRSYHLLLGSDSFRGSGSDFHSEFAVVSPSPRPRGRGLVSAAPPNASANFNAASHGNATNNIRKRYLHTS